MILPSVGQAPPMQIQRYAVRTDRPQAASRAITVSAIHPSAVTVSVRARGRPRSSWAVGAEHISAWPAAQDVCASGPDGLAAQTIVLEAHQPPADLLARAKDSRRRRAMRSPSSRPPTRRRFVYAPSYAGSLLRRDAHGRYHLSGIALAPVLVVADSIIGRDGTIARNGATGDTADFQLLRPKKAALKLGSEIRYSSLFASGEPRPGHNADRWRAAVWSPSQLGRPLAPLLYVHGIQQVIDDVLAKA